MSGEVHLDDVPLVKRFKTEPAGPPQLKKAPKLVHTNAADDTPSLIAKAATFTTNAASFIANAASFIANAGRCIIMYLIS